MKKYPDTITRSPNIAEIEVSYKSKVKPSDRQQITTSAQSAELLKSIWSDKIEYLEEFVILCLNRANKVLGWAKISVGGTCGTICDPKVIFQVALNTNASGIILSHSHPSGNLKPSQADIEITKKLKAGGQILDINVLDHVILVEGDYFSFADNGLM